MMTTSRRVARPVPSPNRRILGGVLAASILTLGIPLASAAPANAAAPDKATKPTTSFSYVSAPGDYIGQGQSETFKPGAGVTLSVQGTKDHLQMSVSAGSSFWNASISPGHGDVLRPGEFRGAERDPFRTGRSPGLDVSGDGRGCNEIYGSFTVDQIGFADDGSINMLDLSFVQHCESPKAPPLKGTIKLNQLPLSYQMVSDTGDYIGQGQKQTYTGSTSLFSLSGRKTGVQASVSGKRDNWQLIMAAPTGQELKAGTTYPTARFADATHAGLDVFGDGRGCNQSTGTLKVLAIATDDGGDVTGLAVKFEQHCEGATPALHGTLHILG